MTHPALDNLPRVEWPEDRPRRVGLRRAPPPSEPLEAFAASDLHGRPIPSREWLVDDLIPMKTVTMIGGDGGTGKSLLALMLAVAAATGRPWLRRDVRPGRALYLSAEDDGDELHRRLADICRAEDMSLADLSGLTMVNRAGKDALLAHLDGSGALEPTPLFEDLKRRVMEERPVAIFLDTSADLFPGNENDRAQVRQFVGMLRGLAIESGAAVVLLSHPSLTGMSSGSGLSGSTAWNNSVRSRLYLERKVENEDGARVEADPDLRILTGRKSNYARVADEIRMHWRDGVFAVDARERTLDRKAKGAAVERKFMELLRLFAEQDRTVNAKGGPNYAPKAFADHPKSEGYTKRAFRAAMESLLADGAIRNETHGPPSRLSTKLVEAVE